MIFIEGFVASIHVQGQQRLNKLVFLFDHQVGQTSKIIVVKGNGDV